tara:strand:- start:365 stop:1336 length:972 start_codon:yes stop_codon:yes gene_type:complete
MGEVNKKQFTDEVKSVIESTKNNLKYDTGEFKENTILEDDVGEEYLDDSDDLPIDIKHPNGKWMAQHVTRHVPDGLEQYEPNFNEFQPQSEINKIDTYGKSVWHDPYKYSSKYDVMLKRNWNFYYHYSYRNFLSTEECYKLINDFETNQFTEYVDKVDGYDERQDFEGTEKKHWRVCDIKWMKYYQKNYAWLFERLDTKIKEVNENVFKFDLTNPILTEPLQFTKYNKGGLYKRHTDWNGMHPDYATRKVSFTINLSCPHNDWTGDGLHVDVPANQEGDHNPWVDKSQGSITFFPSFINHEAMPVDEGTRYVIVGWVHGNPFR